MADTPDSLFNAASNLFERGEMRGLAILFRDDDAVARQALHLFLDKYGSTLAKMVQSQPSDLGVTFELVTDSVAKRAENTLPYQLGKVSEELKIGRMLIYSGAHVLMKVAIADMSLKVGKSESWLYAAWAKFNEHYDEFTEELFILNIREFKKLGKPNPALGTQKQITNFKKKIDPRTSWRREYDTGRVRLDDKGKPIFPLKK